MKKRLFWAVLPLVAMPFFSCEDDEPDVGFTNRASFKNFNPDRFGWERKSTARSH